MGRRNARNALAALVCLVAGCTAPPSASPDGGERADVPAAEPDAPRECVGDDACDDGLYCNGRERCDPGAVGADALGCTGARGRPCLAVQICIEAEMRCVTDCGVDPDADDDGHDDRGCPGGDDCADGDPLRAPGRTEICDEDDRDEDCDPSTFGERDLDHDGAVDLRCCNERDDGARTCGDDCDDTRRVVRPLAAEVCNGLDDDCSGVVDDGVTLALQPDLDGDLHGDDEAEPVPACPGAARVSSTRDDCDDGTVAAHGAQVEICDGIDNDCDGATDEHAQAVTWYRDADGDGFGTAAGGTMVSCAPVPGHSLLSTDCDDGNRARSPVAVEICDGLDDDCNGAADFVVGINDLEDDDGDGHVDAACGGDDCDDDDPSAFAGAPEICDFRDSDCDGLSDLGASPPAGLAADATDEVDSSLDVDGDGWGAGATIRACEPPLGRVVRAGDCAETDPTRHPGAIDGCDGLDDDCDGRVDEAAILRAFYADVDGDGAGDGPAMLACSAPPGAAELPGDCAPASAARGPTAIERCNAVDDDCDMRTDEMLFRDGDGDGHGDPARPVTGACVASDVGAGDDCDDGDATVGATGTCTELCNGFDDDRDGTVDEGAAAACPNASTSTWACTAGACVLGGCRAMADDCDGVAANGCERDLMTDATACGACTTACDVGEGCTAGVCDDPIVDLACTGQGTLALRRSGTAIYWGEGLATAATTGPRVALPGLTGIAGASAIDARAGRGCATVGTEHRCWGESFYSGYYAVSTLGDGAVADVVVPTPLAAGPFREVALGHLHACGLRVGGQVLCWGGGGATFRPLGDGRGVFSHTPVTVLGLADATAISAGTFHTCAIRENEHVVCWGENDSRLGIESRAPRNAPLEEVVDAGGAPLDEVVAISVSTSPAAGPPIDFTCALRRDGTVACWGWHTYGGGGGALGHDDPGGYVSVPHAVDVVSGPGSTTPLGGVTAIETGGFFACASVSGALYCWGRNAAGQLGNGTTTDARAPVAAALPPVDDFCLGGEHGCALLVDGRVFCWGGNIASQLGRDDVASAPMPAEVVSLRRGPP